MKVITFEIEEWMPNVNKAVLSIEIVNSNYTLTFQVPSQASTEQVEEILIAEMARILKKEMRYNMAKFKEGEKND